MLEPDDSICYWEKQAYLMGILAGQSAPKLAADDPAPAYNLTGMLYASEACGKPWGLLSVPNSLVRGVFDAMHEPGIELPLNKQDKLDAHISVFRDSEVEQLGGPSALLNDRGKPFRYSLGRLVSVEPAGWPEMAQCWMLQVHSPELQTLRRSHGLNGLPTNTEGKAMPFHITVAVRRRGVLGRTDKSKDTAAA